ncbi:MAG TPA: RDD family protein [Telluria sp.]|jgi:uncharacterized RDD family membrane protein YckC
MSEQFNPYMAPAAFTEPPAVAEQMRKASNGLRFGTFIIDYVCFGAVAFVCGIAAAIAGPAATELIQTWNGNLFGWVVYIVYFVFFESIWGRTPAKFILGTKVVTDDGGKPGFGTILKRTFCRFIPFEPFSFFGERGWHDSISDTVVIRTR